MKRFPRVIGMLLLITMLLGLAGCAGQSPSSSSSELAKKTAVKPKEAVRSVINKQVGLGDSITVFEKALGKGSPSGGTYSFKDGQFVVEFKPGTGKDIQAAKITINHNPPVSSKMLMPIAQPVSTPQGLVYSDTEFNDVSIKDDNMDLEVFAPGISAYLPADYTVPDGTLRFNKKLHEAFGSFTAQCSSEKLAAAAPDKNGQFNVIVTYDKSNKIITTVISR